MEHRRQLELDMLVPPEDAVTLFPGGAKPTRNTALARASEHSAAGRPSGRAVSHVESMVHGSAGGVCPPRGPSDTGRMGRNVLSYAWPVALVMALALSGCRRDAKPPPPAEPEEAGLARVGSLTIQREDLDHLLAEKYAGRTDDQAERQALQELARRARFAQAGLDAGLLGDPVVRAELARLLEARLREQQLFPEIEALEASGLPESRLRELYESAGSRFVSPEKREVAVLWLDPGQDPLRKENYIEKLTAARTWFFNESELAGHPEKGFAMLSVDHSEHQASRFKNGVVGWVERAGGMDPWRQAVAEIAFALDAVGEVSEVVSRPEGLFLVRLMGLNPAKQVPFEAVSAELAREEQARLRQALESQFEAEIEARYQVEWAEGR